MELIEQARALLAAERALRRYEVLAKSDDREAWLAERKKSIGASEISAVLGVLPVNWGGPFTLYLEKVGQAPEREQTAKMKAGLRLERAIAEWAADDLGLEIVGGGVLTRSVEHPFLSATVDFDVLMRSAPQAGLGVLEIKNVEIRDPLFDEWTEGAPVYYRAQLAQQLVVTGRRWGALAGLVNGHDLRPRIYLADDLADLSARIIPEGRAFWSRVERQDMPAPDGGKAAGAAVLAMVGDEVQGKKVDLPGWSVEADDELERLSGEIDVLFRRRDELRQKLQLAIGDAEEGRIPGRPFAWRFRTITKAGYYVDPQASRQLRRVKARG